MNSSLVEDIQSAVARHELAGAVVLVADKREVLALEAAGWADIGAKKPMTGDTIFWVASQTKPMTAVALMMLVEEGRLNLDDPVEKYLPEFAGQMVAAAKDAGDPLLKKPSRPIAIKNLLTHTSGLPFTTPVEEPTLDLLPLSTRVRSYAASPLVSDPGAGCLYSNAGINTAGYLVEILGGHRFEKFLYERLLRPLGMTDTTFWPGEEQAGRLAQAYKTDPETGGLVEVAIEQLHYPLTDTARRFVIPAGGLFSTARDLATFYRMILNGGALDGRRYLSEDTVREMTRRQTPAGMDPKGYGFVADGTSYGHGGAYSTGTRVDVASGLILVWLMQHADYGGDARKVFEENALARFA